MLEEKTIQFANFNITFGENEEAMLMHFEDSYSLHLQVDISVEKKMSCRDIPLAM